MEIIDKKFCNCGCGIEIPPDRKYASRSCACRQRSRDSWKKPEYRAKQIERIKLDRQRDIEACRLRKIEYWKDEAKRTELSERNIKNFQDPVFKQKHLDGIMKHFADRQNPSRLHLKVKSILNLLWYHDFQTHYTMGPYCFDEADIDNKIVIEINGCYWHGCSQCMPKTSVNNHFWKIVDGNFW